VPDDFAVDAADADVYQLVEQVRLGVRDREIAALLSKLAANT